MNTLSSKVVLVTGGGQGIGAAIARLFAEEGAKVYIGDMDEAVGRLAVSAINNSLGLPEPQRVAFQKLDVTKAESIDLFVSYVKLLHGKIDILVNNAGITKDKMFLKMPRESFEDVLAVNLTGSVDMIRAVLPQMIAQGTGVILNASSVVAENGNIGQSNYAASKAAIESVTQSLARELGRKGIRVNAVAPGFTDTAMVAAMTDEARAATLAKIPLGRLARPEEIAGAYLYLATAEYVTGTTLEINGGLVV